MQLAWTLATAAIDFHTVSASELSRLVLQRPSHHPPLCPAQFPLEMSLSLSVVVNILPLAAYLSRVVIIKALLASPLYPSTVS